MAENKKIGFIAFNDNEHKNNIEITRRIYNVIHEFILNYRNFILLEVVPEVGFYLEMTKICNVKENRNVFPTHSRRYLRRLDIRVETGSQMYLLSEIKNRRDLMLSYCAVWINKLIDMITSKTGYILKGGISFNKMMAKIACDIFPHHGITVINTYSGMKRILQYYKIKKFHVLRGDLMERVKDELNIKTVGQLGDFYKYELENIFGEEDGQHLWKVSRGIDNRPVVSRISEDLVIMR